ncbi:MAG: hypothetical protein AAF682_31625 [Planctomycetota bacterium]
MSPLAKGGALLAAVAAGLLLLGWIASRPVNDSRAGPRIDLAGAGQDRAGGLAEPGAAAADSGWSRPPSRVEPLRAGAAAPVVEPEVGVRIHVSDGAGRSLAGAEVTSGAVLGVTSAAGELECRWSDLRAGVVAARAPGFARTTVYLAEPPADSIQVVLKPVASIDGVVLDPQGRRAGGGLRVLAWPQRRLWLDVHAFESHADGTGPFEAITAADGSFRFEDVALGEAYGLAAGGRGLASLEHSSVVTPSEASVELVVVPLAGVAVRFAGPFGPVSTEVHATLREGFQLPEGVQRVRPWPTAAWLAGVHSSRLSSREGLVMLVADRTGPGRSEALRTRLRCWIPGYEAVDAPLELVALSEGWTEARVELTPLDEGGFGSLVLLRETAPLAGAIAPSAGSSGPPDDASVASADVSVPFGDATEALEGTVHLVPVDVEPAPLFLLRLPPWSDGRAQLDGIPVGEYELEVRLRASGPVPGLPARIRIDSTPCEVTLPSEDTGRIVVRLRDRSGNAYDGPVDLIVGHGSPVHTGQGLELTSMGSARHLRGPYTYSLVPAGDYSVLLTSPRIRTAGPNPRAARVAAGQRTVVEFTLLD